jgi:heme-degrading monooxygenase HmoA
VSVVSVLELPVREGAEEAITGAYAEGKNFELSHESGGFLGGRLLRPLVSGAPFLVIAEWETPADYQRWLDNSVRATLAALIAPQLVGEVPVGLVYQDA